MNKWADMAREAADEAQRRKDAIAAEKAAAERRADEKRQADTATVDARVMPMLVEIANALNGNGTSATIHRMQGDGRLGAVLTLRKIGYASDRLTVTVSVVIRPHDYIITVAGGNYDAVEGQWSEDDLGGAIERAVKDALSRHMGNK